MWKESIIDSDELLDGENTVFKFLRRVVDGIACKRALRTGYSEIYFRIARGRGSLAIGKQISEEPIWEACLQAIDGVINCT